MTSDFQGIQKEMSDRAFLHREKQLHLLRLQVMLTVSRLCSSWPTLPAHIKAAVLALLQTATHS